MTIKRMKMFGSLALAAAAFVFLAGCGGSYYKIGHYGGYGHGYKSTHYGHGSYYKHRGHHGKQYGHGYNSKHYGHGHRSHRGHGHCDY